MKTQYQIKKIISKEYESILTSYHEAGHAVIGLLNYIKIDNICLFNKKDVYGHSYFFSYKTNCSNINKKNYYKRQVQFYYGGMAAEQVFYNKCIGTYLLPFILKSYWQSDKTNISYIIRSKKLAKSGSNTKSFKNKILKETISNVNIFWDDIVLISQKLFKCKKIKFNKLKQILCELSANKNYWKSIFLTISKIEENNFILTNEICKQM